MSIGTKWQRVWFAAHAASTTMFVVWLGTTALATEIPDTGGRVEVGGHVDGRAVVPTEHSQRQRPGALADVWLDTRITDRLRGRIDLRGAIGGPFEGANLGTFNFSDAFQDYSPSLEVHEAYVDVRFSDADVRLGVQSVAWGKLDGLPPTDVINPRDFRDPLVDDFEEAKIGIPAVAGSYYFPDWSAVALSQLRATLVYVPLAVPSRLPLPDERWFPASIATDSFTVDPKQIREQFGVTLVGDPRVPVRLDTMNREPPHAVSDGGIGFRLSGIWRETDWDLYHYSGPYTGPNADVRVRVHGTVDPNERTLSLSHADALLVQDHDVTHMTGADLATTIGGATVRAEAAYFVNHPYLRVTSDLVRDSLRNLSGDEIKAIQTEFLTEGSAQVPIDDLFPKLDSVEWGIGIDYLFHGIYPLLQLNQIVILDSAPRLLIANPETRLTALVRRAFWQDRLELELRAFYAFERESWFVFPRASYRVTDNLRLRVGYLAISGPTDSLIGQFHRNDEVVFQARYSF